MDAPFKKILSQLGVNWSRLDKHVYTVKLNMSKILQMYRLFLREFNKVEKDLDLWKQQQQQKRVQKKLKRVELFNDNTAICWGW